MSVVSRCADELIPFLDALLEGDRERATRHGDRIFELEHDADRLKNELRSHLPRHLFMPVDRRDLLHLLGAQDSIADRAQDVAALLLLRPVVVPPFLSDALPELVARSVDAVHKAAEAIGEIDDLLESGFRGAEIDRCHEIIGEISGIESETDDLGLRMLGLLFDHEQDMSALRLVFWQRVIQRIGQAADHAENVGDRLRLLIAR